MKTLLGNLLFFAVMLLIITRMMSVTTGAVFPVDIVTSGSMNPSLMTGDLVAWTPTSIHDVRVGDVIVYKSWLSWPDTKLVIHRVVEIRQDFGKIALVTKGDANQWTDQAGPHIPEPYVNEKNFVGRAIMVGPVPLKIPFVGYLGILVNEGFQLLSQSTASKGTTASIVVFMPLTISVILLVVAVLLFPQRRKTIQEKIHYYIFSSRSLNLKKTAVFFFVIFTVFLLIIHLFAFDSITGAVGVGEFASKDGMDLGALARGQTGQSKEITIVNPSVFPMKGVVFGKGGIATLLNPATFQVGSGQIKVQAIHATVPNGTANGSYLGDIAIYSSPLWVIIPDEFLLAAVHFNAQAAVLLIDLLSALLLTILTILLMAGVAFIQERITVLQVDRSWQHASRPLLKTSLRQRLRRARDAVHQKLQKNIYWMNQVNLATLQTRPVLVGVLIVIPFFLFLRSETAAMIIAALLTGIIAYFFKCRLRQKIVLATTFSLVVSLGIILIHASLGIFSMAQPLMVSLSLTMGLLGVYLLAFTFLMTPLVLLSWFITHRFRNVKEQRDPLLALEGGCDL